MHKTPRRLLIIDDEPLNRELLRRVLRGDYDISEAGDASEAIEVLEEEAISLILCDHLMPGKTGAELAVIVNERWPETPFMLLTGYDGDAEVLRVHAAGFVKDVLSKPWRAKDLRASIALHLPPGH